MLLSLGGGMSRDSCIFLVFLWYRCAGFPCCGVCAAGCLWGRLGGCGVCLGAGMSFPLRDSLFHTSVK